MLPIVLYNGDAPWTAATNISELIPKVPGLVAQFLPSLQYLLIEENRYAGTDLASMQNLVATLSTASTAQLEAWTDRFLSARTLAEVFAPPSSPL